MSGIAVERKQEHGQRSKDSHKFSDDDTKERKEIQGVNKALKQKKRIREG